MNNHVKYPKTLHLSFSPGLTSGDRVLSDPSCLHGKRFVITEKMDGENTTFYSDGFHARSVNYRHNFTRDQIAQYHAQVKYLIPDGWRVCGENLTYEHSIRYENLKHIFQVFSVWNEANICLSWEDTVKFCQETGFQMVPVAAYTMNRSGSDEQEIEFAIKHYMNYVKLQASAINPRQIEGFVARNIEQFHYDDFQKNVFKWVRENHVQTDDEHWLKNTKKNGVL